MPSTSIELPDGLQVEVVDPVLAPDRQWDRLLELYRRVAEAVAAESVATRTATAGAAAAPVPAVVSGDCLVALGTVAGVQRAGIDAGLVWFDAHGDVHTMDSSTSGYLGGMALRMALGGDPHALTGPLGLRPLGEDRVVLVPRP